MSPATLQDDPSVLDFHSYTVTDSPRNAVGSSDGVVCVNIISEDYTNICDHFRTTDCHLDIDGLNRLPEQGV